MVQTVKYHDRFVLGVGLFVVVWFFFLSGRGQIFSTSKCLSEVIWIILGYSFSVKTFKNIYILKRDLSDSGNSYKFKCYR